MGAGSSSPWTLERPARISVAGRVLEAQDDLMVLGLSVVTAGPPWFERRIAKVWLAFYTRGVRLTPNSKYLSFGANLERWLRLVSPALAFGSLGCLWSAMVKRRVGATVNRMIRNAMGLRKLDEEEEAWLSWRTRTFMDAWSWIINEALLHVVCVACQTVRQEVSALACVA